MAFASEPTHSDITTLQAAYTAESLAVYIYTAIIDNFGAFKHPKLVRAYLGAVQTFSSLDLKVIAAQVAANEASHFSFFDAAAGGHGVLPSLPKPTRSSTQSRSSSRSWPSPGAVEQRGERVGVDLRAPRGMGSQGGSHPDSASAA